MLQFIVKTVLSALIIASVSTISKRIPLVGAILISLPLTSILALIWLYSDTRDSQKIVDLSNNICLMIIPSIIFFIALTLLIKSNVKFQYSIIAASVIMIISYAVYVFFLRKFGIKI